MEDWMSTCDCAYCDFIIVSYPSGVYGKRNCMMSEEDCRLSTANDFVATWDD